MLVASMGATPLLSMLVPLPDGPNPTNGLGVTPAMPVPGARPGSRPRAGAYASSCGWGACASACGRGACACACGRGSSAYPSSAVNYKKEQPRIIYIIQENYPPPSDRNTFVRSKDVCR